MVLTVNAKSHLRSEMVTAAASNSATKSWRFAVGKALLLAMAGLLLVPLAFLEAASQLPNGKASPLQAPILTTPTTIQLTKKDRERVVRGDVTGMDLANLVAIAGKRLADEPLDPNALWLWSLGQGPATSRKALDLAQQMSLRETTVQLQLMRLKALSGDLPASFAHLDHALLVSPSARLPVLQAITKSLDKPELLGLLKPYGDRPWYKLLLEQSVHHAPRPENAVDLLMQTELTAGDLPPKLVYNLLMRLVMAGNYRDAEVVAAQFAGVTSADLKQFAPTAKTMVADAIPLTWAFVDDANLSAEPVLNGVSFEIERGMGGTLMTRVTSFPKGTYTLRQTIKVSTSDLAVRWEMQCWNNGLFRKSWVQPIPAVTKKQVFETRVPIDGICDIQRWELVGLNQYGTERAKISVTDLNLTRR
jgi:hypothetical protein